MRCLLLSSIVVLSTPSLSYATNFNNFFIRSENSVDLSKFSTANFVEDGSYDLDVYINGEFLTTDKILFSNNEPCISEVLVDSLPFNDRGYKLYKEQIESIEGAVCYKIDNIEYTKVVSDLGKGRIDISTPQEYIANEYKYGFVPDRLWDDGISALYLDYNINYFSSQQDDENGWNDDLSTYGIVGANAGAFRFRANYQASNNYSGEFTSLYGYTPVRSIKSKLTFGNTQFGSDVYDSFQMTGVRLQSDDQMLPSNLRGYSPVVSGTVSTNAVITVRQQGNVLKVVNVNAGPYLIDDLAQASKGTLDVEVKQADGKIQRYQVNGADVLYLTRPNHLRYSVSVGVPDSETYEHKPEFFSAEASYGINNYVSVFSATLLSEDYQSYTVGTGVNLNYFGAASVDVSTAKATLGDTSDVSGISYGVTYNNTLTDFGLGLRIAGYRFSEEQYYEFDEYLNSYDDVTSSFVYAANNNRKDEKQIALTQSFGVTSAYVSYTSNNYWDNRRDSSRYDVNLSHPINLNGINLYLTLNLYQADDSYLTYNYESGVQEYSPSSGEKGWSLGISIPIGGSNSVSVQTNSRDGDYSQTLSYSGYDKGDGSNYRVAYDVYEGESNGVSGNYSRDLSFVSTSFGGSYKTDSYSQVNANATGTVLLSEHGLAYSALNSGTSRILIDSSVSDVTINGSHHEKTNEFGLALINGVTPYQKSYNTIDFKSLPDNIEVLDSVKSMVLTEGAIGYQKIKARKGSNFLAHLEGDKEVPFGALVFDDELNQEIGIVGQDSTVYVVGVNIDSNISVNWGDNESCHLVIDESILESQEVIRSVNCEN
ncbi:fimbria/pilus outer membrane usher protein [Vibrio sp. OCN044]|uniref:Fimbria/pilus outer membrane usher protein n=1 Tax=Vibrio tetraodonis subsp. pristinus TaxID=2695891 RepID=A0A6L8M2T7_9VIBR|nr:fimbria/pilus outer membrane usher protein [Vibrio tetraodonis]MYM60109.1 fimbria/pilus outer membrane usher protein [Vibrio tetraodonis subsp. pristinus]